MKRNVFAVIVFIIMLTVFSSCTKEPGTGGLATIQGNVYAYNYSAFGTLVDSGYAAGEKVYIAYGDNTGVDDNTDTDPDGNFSFKWLQKGDYKIWVISKCEACPLGDSILTQNVSIDSRKQVLNASQFIIRR